MSLWLQLAPRIADVAISRGVQEVKNLRPEENGRKFWKTRTGRTGRLRWARGWADVGQRRGGRAKGGQTSGLVDERTSVQADESGQGADRVD